MVFSQPTLLGWIVLVVRIPLVVLHALEVWLWSYSHEKQGCFRKVQAEGTGMCRTSPDGSGRSRLCYKGLDTSRRVWKVLEGSWYLLDGS